MDSYIFFNGFFLYLPLLCFCTTLKKRGRSTGYSEKIYEEALYIELQDAGIKFDKQRVAPVVYKDRFVGEGYSDVVANFNGNKLVVELKAKTSSLGEGERTQLLNYMKVLKIDNGLLVNFIQKKGKTDLEFIRLNKNEMD